MSPEAILGCVAIYFGLLLFIGWLTSRNATNDTYFRGNNASPWFAVAFGLIGDSLSGVTFISVPGQVAVQKFSYMQIVFGYAVGYVVIAQVLLPLYYRLNLTSIYSFLLDRFGLISQRTGAAFFLLSRILGAAARLYLSAIVLQTFVLDRWNVPFAVTVAVIIALMLAYTFRGGIRTLVWTDTIQSTFLLLGLVTAFIALARAISWDSALEVITTGPHSKIFIWDLNDPRSFWRDFVGGAFIAIAMTGLDQNMMQKNLSCRSLPAAQKNFYAFAAIVVFVNFLFVALGALLYHFVLSRGIPMPERPDLLFPSVALHHLGPAIAVIFVLGLTAATFSSADSVLTTLTTSFCVDFLGFDDRAIATQEKLRRYRHMAHLGFAVILLGVILIFKMWNKASVITAVLKIAAYTYGPLLGLFAFGILLKRKVRESLVPLVCLAAPFACLFLEIQAPNFSPRYRPGNELLLINGMLTFAGLWLISRRSTDQVQK